MSEFRRTERHGPILFEADELETAPHDAFSAPPPPEGRVDPAAAKAVRVAARGKGSSLGRWFWSALAGLVGLAVSMATYEFVVGLLARYPVLGALATALTVIVVGALALFGLREAAGLARLGRVDDIRTAADRALREKNRAEALKATRALARLYGRRRDVEWGLADLKTREADLLDADALLGHAEHVLLAPLDKAAERAVGQSARTVAAATAIVPLALVDVLTALVTNVRMIRMVAEIYGGRAGWLGSVRLLRLVAGHLVATGAVAIGDDFMHAAFGGGLLAKVSRRLGEGLVNGALTARIGAAAMEVCRPLPFKAEEKPTGRKLAGAALRDLVQKN